MIHYCQAGDAAAATFGDLQCGAFGTTAALAKCKAMPAVPPCGAEHGAGGTHPVAWLCVLFVLVAVLHLSGCFKGQSVGVGVVTAAPPPAAAAAAATAASKTTII